jgi:hypothetical protein
MMCGHPALPPLRDNPAACPVQKGLTLAPGLRFRICRGQAVFWILAVVPEWVRLLAL